MATNVATVYDEYDANILMNNLNHLLSDKYGKKWEVSIMTESFRSAFNEPRLSGAASPVVVPNVASSSSSTSSSSSSSSTSTPLQSKTTVAASPTPRARLPEGRIVSLMGELNHGKTFVLNLLCGKKFAHGHDKATEGMSLFLSQGWPKEGVEDQDALVGQKSHIFIDRRGQNTPIRFSKDLTANEAFADRVASDVLINRVMLEFSTYFIFVVRDMTDRTQMNIQQFQEHCKSQGRSDQEKKIIVIHNYQSARTVDEGMKEFQRLVLDTYNMLDFKPHHVLVKQASGVTYFEVAATADTKQLFPHRHIFLINDDEKGEGKKFNRLQVNTVRNWLDSVIGSYQLESLVPRLCSQINAVLKRFLNPVNASSPDAEIEYRPEMHAFKLKGTAEYKITSLLIEDGMGAFLQATQYVPQYTHYELKDCYYVIVDLPGKWKKKAKEMVKAYLIESNSDNPMMKNHKVLVIKGNRLPPLEARPDAKIISSVKEFGNWEIKVVLATDVYDPEREFDEESRTCIIKLPFRRFGEQPDSSDDEDADDDDDGEGKGDPDDNNNNNNNKGKEDKKKKSKAAEPQQKKKE